MGRESTRIFNAHPCIPRGPSRYPPDGDADTADEEAGRGLILNAGGGITGRPDCRQSDAPGEEQDDGRDGRQDDLGPPREPRRATEGVGRGFDETIGLVAGPTRFVW